jgi:hypothetical protein
LYALLPTAFIVEASAAPKPETMTLPAAAQAVSYCANAALLDAMIEAGGWWISRLVTTLCLLVRKPTSRCEHPAWMPDLIDVGDLCRRESVLLVGLQTRHATPERVRWAAGSALT